MDNLLPGWMQKVPHLQAFDVLFANRFTNLDFTPCMMYLIDTCGPAALPFLALQFDMAQYRDYALAANDDERRAILKQSIAKRAAMGTVQTVEDALTVSGFDPAWLVERCNEGIDPVRGWACFKVVPPTAGFNPINGVPGLALSDLIMQVKPVRCKWLGVEYEIDGFTDSYPLPTETTETVSLGVNYAIVDRQDTGSFQYNGLHRYNGVMQYKPGVEDIRIHIV